MKNPASYEARGIQAEMSSRDYIKELNRRIEICQCDIVFGNNIEENVIKENCMLEIITWIKEVTK